MASKQKRMNLLRDASKSNTFLDTVRKAKLNQDSRKTRLEKRAESIATGEEPSSSDGDDLSDTDKYYTHECEEGVFYSTIDEVLSHVYDDFKYDYTQHSCEFFKGMLRLIYSVYYTER